MEAKLPFETNVGAPPSLGRLLRVAAGKAEIAPQRKRVADATGQSGVARIVRNGKYLMRRADYVALGQAVPEKPDKPYTRDANGAIVFPRGAGERHSGRFSFTPRG